MNVKHTEPNQTLSPEESDLIESLLKYPSLEKVFDPQDEKQFAAMKLKMQATIDDLERVIRRGSNEDAAKAAKIVEAYRITLSFLDELDARRRTQ